MDLKARIAARKAALAADSGLVQPVTQQQANATVTIDITSKEVSAISALGLDVPFVEQAGKVIQGRLETMGVTTEEFLNTTGVVAEPALTPSNKPMTFAERMALKKRQAEQAVTNPTPASATASTAQTVLNLTPAVPKEPPVITLTEEQLEVLSEADNSELAQAYSDVALAINKLQYTDDGESLAGAMNDLKRALKQNISASMLLLDSDIGKMVVALRRYTGVELAEVKEKKASTSGGGKTKRTAAITLTAEDIEKALATDF